MLESGWQPHVDVRARELECAVSDADHRIRARDQKQLTANRIPRIAEQPLRKTFADHRRWQRVVG